MKNSIYVHRSRLFILLLLMFGSACQPVQVLPSPIPSQTLPAVTVAPTKTSVVPSPTLLPPTVTASPVATAIPAPLSTEGPWLVYNYRFIVNQDGTGRKEIEAHCAGYTPEDPCNRLAIFPSAIHLFRPSQGMWAAIENSQPPRIYDFTGNEEHGFLASISWDTVPELFIHELPGGKIWDRFTLGFTCPEPYSSCYPEGMSWWGLDLEWSPDGRYLAFTALLDGNTSDLYVYDVQHGSKRRLTSGPDMVGPFWWSPDGSRIIMAEALDSSLPNITSLRAISVSTNETRLLYKPDEDQHPLLGLFEWLDDRRFIIYEGVTLDDALALPASNLRLVDMESGEITTLFDGSFMAVDLDPVHEALIVWAYNHEREEEGIYLFSTSNTKSRYMGWTASFPTWDAELGVFLTEKPCEDDQEGKQAFDYKGEWQCIHSALPDRYPSPDGMWQVSIREGTWLMGEGKQPLQISEGKAVQVIWRPDSAGFFLVVDQDLYYVSLPQSTLTQVDRYVDPPIDYQWLEK